MVVLLNHYGWVTQPRELQFEINPSWRCICCSSDSSPSIKTRRGQQENWFLPSANEQGTNDSEGWKPQDLRGYLITPSLSLSAERLLWLRHWSFTARWLQPHSAGGEKKAGGQISGRGRLIAALSRQVLWRNKSSPTGCCFCLSPTIPGMPQSTHTSCCSSLNR